MRTLLQFSTALVLFKEQLLLKLLRSTLTRTDLVLQISHNKLRARVQYTTLSLKSQLSENTSLILHSRPIERCLLTIHKQSPCVSSSGSQGQVLVLVHLCAKDDPLYRS